MSSGSPARSRRHRRSPTPGRRRPGQELDRTDTDVQRLAEDCWIEWGGELIWVVGYTSGGAPYGLRVCDFDRADLEVMGLDVAALTVVSNVVHRGDGMNVTVFGFDSGEELTEHPSTCRETLTGPWQRCVRPGPARRRAARRSLLRDLPRALASTSGVESRRSIRLYTRLQVPVLPSGPGAAVLRGMSTNVWHIGTYVRTMLERIGSVSGRREAPHAARQSRLAPVSSRPPINRTLGSPQSGCKRAHISGSIPPDPSRDRLTDQPECRGLGTGLACRLRRHRRTWPWGTQPDRHCAPARASP